MRPAMMLSLLLLATGCRTVLVHEAEVLRGTRAEEAGPRLERGLPRRVRPFVRLRPDAAIARPDFQPGILVRRLEAPLLVLHGTRDRLLPPRMGRAVVVAAGSERKTFCPVPGAGHDDLWRAHEAGGDACLHPFLATVGT